MPQMNKGEKYIFGKSLIRDDGSMLLPPMAVREYDMAAENSAANYYCILDFLT